MQEIQLDFKDDSTVPADPLGKRQHVVETCNVVDAGTSIWLYAPVREAFTADTAFDAVVEFLRLYGLPSVLTFDRDPRWIGSASGRDFPSALVRFLLCLGIQPNICPAHRPDKNCYVERLHRTYKYEGLTFASTWHAGASAGSYRAVPNALPYRATPSRPGLWECATTCRLPDSAPASCAAFAGRPGRLAIDASMDAPLLARCALMAVSPLMTCATMSSRVWLGR